MRTLYESLSEQCGIFSAANIMTETITETDDFPLDVSTCEFRTLTT